MTSFESKNNVRNGIDKSYRKIKHELSPTKDTAYQHPSILHNKEQRSEENNIFQNLFSNLKNLIKNSKSSESYAMELVYHVWEDDQLDSLIDLFTSLKDSKNPKAKINIKYDDSHVFFETPKKTVKAKFDKNALHHIFSYCNGPIDTVAKINYHSRNAGPVDAPDEIKYLSDSPGPIDAIMELLYHTRNEGQVDTIFEWYRLVRNSGDISSRDEIQYHNQNPGPQDTKGEWLRRSKNIGPVDTQDEKNFYGINKESSSNPNNTGPIDTQAEMEARGKKDTNETIFNPRPKPY